MTTAIFDALIIGMGQAGPFLAARLSGAGMKVAVVEKHKFGGTCVNNGCTPTKAMVASAYAAHVARRAREYGVLVEGAPQVDMKRVKARKDEIVRNVSEGEEKWMEGLKGAKVYRGHESAAFQALSMAWSVGAQCRGVRQSLSSSASNIRMHNASAAVLEP